MHLHSRGRSIFAAVTLMLLGGLLLFGRAALTFPAPRGEIEASPRAGWLIQAAPLLGVPFCLIQQLER